MLFYYHLIQFKDTEHFYSLSGVFRPVYLSCTCLAVAPARVFAFFIANSIGNQSIAKQKCSLSTHAARGGGGQEGERE